MVASENRRRIHNSRPRITSGLRKQQSALFLLSFCRSAMRRSHEITTPSMSEFGVAYNQKLDHLL
jgi:hypothetical protein